MPMRPHNYSVANRLNALTLRNKRYLDYVFYVAKSPIDGVGVFARVDIPAGAYLGEYEGPAPTATELAISPYTFELGGKIRDGRTLLRFLNHDGKNPNSYFTDGFKMYAERDIRAGEEVTFDYGNKPNTTIANNLRVAALRRWAPIEAR